MEELITNKKILEHISKLQKTVELLAKTIETNEDTLLSQEEIRLVNQSITNQKRGRLFSFEDITAYKKQ